MTVKKPKISKAGKAQKISDKATLKMHNDVTASLEQLEHPELKAKKKSAIHKAISVVKCYSTEARKKIEKEIISGWVMFDLIYLAVIFLILALIFYIAGARGIAGFSMDIAKWLVIIFVVVAVVSFLL
jgi:uncharacterized membrane protein YtjA (UPF0391 family)